MLIDFLRRVRASKLVSRDRILGSALDIVLWWGSHRESNHRHERIPEPNSIHVAVLRELNEIARAPVARATERFRDVNVALAEGYIRDPFDLCDTAEMMGRPANLGAMGVYYFKPDVLGITGPPNPKVSGTGIHTDFLKPSILIYEPQANGSLELVAVDNLAFEAAWKAAGNSKPPSFHGVAYNYMADDPATAADDAHPFAPHYDRHVWIYRENPNGVFAPFNPKVSCAHHKGATMKMPGMKHRRDRRD